MGWVKTSDLPMRFERRLDESRRSRSLEEPRDNEAQREINGGVHDALAQFVQMLHQAHAREFCAF